MTTEKYAILSFDGPVGCGKSTLLRVIRGMIRHSTNMKYEAMGGHRIKVWWKDPTGLTTVNSEGGD